MSTQAETSSQKFALRRKTRGAALVEAVGASFFFLVIFFCLVFIFNTYSARHSLVADARAQAWSKAMGGCAGGADRVEQEGGLDEMQDRAPSRVDSPDRELENPTAEGHRGDVLEAAETTDSLEMGTESGKAVAVAERGLSAEALGFGTPTVRAERALQCDEQPRDGDILSALGFFWDTFGPGDPHD